MVNKNSLFSIVCFILLSLWGLLNEAEAKSTCFSLDVSELQTPAIDSLDTVIFDLSQAVYGSNTVYFPVYFSSDDLVYALDFALRYDDSRLVYDTITLAPAGSGLLAYSFLNPADSTIRFTSSQFVALPNRQPIAYVHFELASGTTSLDTSDFYNLRGLLNGDPCTELVIPPGVTGLNESVHSIEIKVYPNPSTGQFMVNTEEQCQFVLFNENGEHVLFDENKLVPGVNPIHLPADLADGVYLIYLQTKDRFGYSKLLLLRR
ncbi:MAG: T9SS type A sorting domain-containing protein [Bacteroidota bacterium]